MTYRTIDLQVKPPIAQIRLTRTTSERGLVDEIDRACDELHDNAEVRVVVVIGSGNVVSTGWDTAELSQEGGTLSFAVTPFRALENLAQPIICAVNGPAISVGLELALACDVRIASERARFALPETASGMLPMAGGTQRLPRIVGRAEALRLVLLGEEIDATEALRIGLVSAIHPDSELMSAAEELALRMAERGPLALRYAKEAVRRGLDLPIDQGLRMETDLTVLLQSTEDRAEGVRAFIGKRPPRFKGR
jgi:enoyl-CoA hydratase/carnithine racemase